MTVFTIHIIELLTLGLILLSIFRIFKQLSLETENNSFSQAYPKKNIAQSQIIQTAPAQSIESIVAQDNNTAIIIDIDNTSHKAESQNTRKETPEQHQALLKNYIGDFF